jgi:hypothetical protein
MKRILRLMAVMVVVFLGFLGYARWSRTRALRAGEVRVRPEPAENPKAANPAANQPQEVAESAGGEASNPQPQNSVVTLPAAQTISRNPPNGLVVSGTGKFQLYRQGDITWRMNTETGEACVLFATEAMWHRALVYEHGCGGH